MYICRIKIHTRIYAKFVHWNTDVIILANKNDVVAGFISRNQYVFTLSLCQVCLDMWVV